jgi:hypothetical protein
MEPGPNPRTATSALPISRLINLSRRINLSRELCRLLGLTVAKVEWGHPQGAYVTPHLYLAVRGTLPQQSTRTVLTAV